MHVRVVQLIQNVLLRCFYYKHSALGIHLSFVDARMFTHRKNIQKKWSMCIPITVMLLYVRY